MFRVALDMPTDRRRIRGVAEARPLNMLLTATHAGGCSDGAGSNDRLARLLQSSATHLKEDDPRTFVEKIRMNSEGSDSTRPLPRWRTRILDLGILLLVVWSVLGYLTGRFGVSPTRAESTDAASAAARTNLVPSTAIVGRAFPPFDAFMRDGSISQVDIASRKTTLAMIFRSDCRFCEQNAPI